MWKTVFSVVFQLVGAELMIAKYMWPLSLKKVINIFSVQDDDYGDINENVDEYSMVKKEVLVGRIAFLFIFGGYVISILPNSYIINDYIPLIMCILISVIITILICWLLRDKNGKNNTHIYDCDRSSR